MKAVREAGRHKSQNISPSRALAHELRLPKAERISDRSERILMPTRADHVLQFFASAYEDMGEWAADMPTRNCLALRVQGLTAVGSCFPSSRRTCARLMDARLSRGARLRSLLNPLVFVVIGTGRWPAFDLRSIGKNLRQARPVLVSSTSAWPLCFPLRVDRRLWLCCRSSLASVDHGTICKYLWRQLGPMF